MKKILLILILSNLFIILTAKSVPYWVEKRPIDKDYYIGIGMAKISKGDTDYIQIAKDNALKNLASEIKVNISSEVLSKVSENNGKLKELVQTSVKTTTQADLEGFELVDTYKDKNYYWVYYRLSKALYKKIREKKIKSVLAQALSLYKKAKEYEKENDIVSATDFLFQALDIIKKYPDEKVEIEGKSVYLFNETISRIKLLFKNIHLESNMPKFTVKFNKKIKEHPFVKAYYKDKDRVVPDLPLIVQFIKGEGEILTKEKTNKNGTAEIHINKVTSAQKLQILKIAVDKNGIINGDSLSSLAKEVINLLNVAETKIFITVEGLLFYVEANENILGQKSDIKILEPKIKEGLLKRNITFVETPEKADAILTISASTNEGGEFYGMYSAYADVEISLTDLENGKEIYNNTFSKIKGIDKNYKKAAKKALSNAAGEILSNLENILKKNF